MNVLIDMKNFFKKILTFILFLLLLPLFVWERLPISEYSAYTAPSQLLAFIPGVFGIYIRRVWYKHTLKKCGKNLTVDWMAVLRTREAEIGDRCTFGVYSWIGWARVGSDVMTGSHVVLTSGSNQHSYGQFDKPMREQKGVKRRVDLGNDVWIGAHAIIMNDISDGSIVGAGSVVTKKFDSFQIVAGNPAVVIKKRSA